MPLNSDETAGQFRVWLSYGAEQGLLMWDRKIEGGFPELKVLVKRFSGVSGKENLTKTCFAETTNPRQDSARKVVGTFRQEGGVGVLRCTIAINSKLIANQQFICDLLSLLMDSDPSRLEKLISQCKSNGTRPPILRFISRRFHRRCRCQGRCSHKTPTLVRIQHSGTRPLLLYEILSFLSLLIRLTTPTLSLTYSSPVSERRTNS